MYLFIIKGTNISAGKATGIVVRTGLDTEIGNFLAWCRFLQEYFLDYWS